MRSAGNFRTTIMLLKLTICTKQINKKNGKMFIRVNYNQIWKKNSTSSYIPPKTDHYKKKTQSKHRLNKKLMSAILRVITY